jgi:DNA-binding MarR family transcriptional regulator
VTLTGKGRQIFEKLWKKSEPLRARLLAAFRPNEVTALVELLHRVAEVMATSNGRRTARSQAARR